jgi:hypothetical protein
VLPARPPTLSILDPVSLLGRELVERVAHDLPDVRRRLFHTGSEAEHLAIEVAGEPALVSPLLDLDELDGSSAVAVTRSLTPSVGERLLGWLRAHASVRLLDCSQPGLAGAEAASVIADLPRGHRGRPWFHLADPALIGPARLVTALAPLAPTSLHLTVLVPASAYGVEALEELLAQGAARLSGRAPKPATHLPGILAFDLLTAREERVSALEAQIAELFPALEVHLQLADAGVFHGYFASAAVRCSHQVSAQVVRSLLRGSDGLRSARRNARFSVSGAAEADGVLVGELRVRQDWVLAWLATEGLRVGGADAAVSALIGLVAS